MGTVTKEGRQWVWRGDWSEKAIPKDAKWRWNPKLYYWATQDRTRALLLAAYADSEDVFAETAPVNVNASRAVSADIDVPAPEGCEYMPFQLAGIKYMLGTECGNALNADVMGLGKTIQALGLINAVPSIRSVLVVCPATIKVHWAREAQKWMVRPVNVVVWDSKDTATPVAPPKQGLSIHIANWDILTRRRQRGDPDKSYARPSWLALKPDLLILDESHRMKSKDAQRTKAAKEIANTSKHVLALTGTPLLNRPVELWTTVHLLDPGGWPGRRAYVEYYCDAGMKQKTNKKRVWDESGASHLNELQNRLRDTVMVRRLKEDVLKELPPKRRQVIQLDTAKYGSILTAERDVVTRGKHAIAESRAALAKIDQKENAADYREAVRTLRHSTNVAFQEISAVRHETALAKVQDVAAFVEDALDSEDKVLLFAHHTDVIESVAQILAKHGVVTLTGQHSQAHRNQAIDNFQTRSEVRVFCGSTLAAGEGITLTAASTVVFAELDWTPAKMSQAEDRVHRIGQLQSVSIYHLVVDGSLDAKMAAMLVAKQQILDAALDDAPGDLAITPFEMLGLTEGETNG